MARKTITQRISLDGGKEIEGQLKALGAAGEKAFNQIKNAALKADLAKFGASLKTFGSDLATVGRRIALLGAGVTASAAGAGAAVLGLAKSGAEAADAAGKAAQKTGLQIDAYGRLSFAAKQADVDQDQFVAGMSRLNKAIAEAATETQKAGQAIDASGVSVQRFRGKTKALTDATKQAGNIFTRLGVSIKDANGKLRPTEAIVQDIAEAFARMPDGALKSALAIELFGKAGAELIPFLNQGKQGLRELGEEAAKLGILFTPEQFALGDAVGDSLDSLGTALKAIRAQLGLLFAPIVLAGAKGLTDIIVENKDAILELGSAAARGVASVLGDLLHLLSGNTQNIKNPWIRDWAVAIIQFGKDVAAVVNTVVLPLFKAVRESAQFVAEQINKIFGTDMNGDQLLIGSVILGIIGFFALLFSAIGAVITLFGLFGDAAAAIAVGAVGLGIAIAAFWDEIKAGAASAWQFVTDSAASAWQSIVQGATDLWGQIVGAFQAGQQLAVEAFNAIVEAIVSAWNGLVDRLGSIAQQVVERIVGVFESIKARLSAIWNSVIGTAQSALGRITSFVDSIISKITAAINKLKQLVGLGSDSGAGGGGSTQGFAGGGSVRGPGGPRTDSILARLSAGEFVIQAKVVRKLGVDFFHRLNNGLVPSLQGLRGFSLGGFADSFNRSMAIPRFADGGFAKMQLAPAGISGASGLTNVRLDFGLGPDDVFDLIGENHVVRKLQTAAVKSGLLTTGRKPRRR